MKKLFWFVFLAGMFISMDLWTYNQIHGEPAAATAANTLSSQPVQLAALPTAPPNTSSLRSADMSSTAAQVQAVEPKEPTDVSLPKAMPPLKLGLVNGVSLADDLKTVYEIKGIPLKIEQDDVLRLSKVYTFEDCSIGMVDGSIQYVVVPASKSKLEVDGQILPMNLQKLKERLGKPYFVSEDGLVYKNGSNALKIFLNPETGEMVSIHYFHASGE